MTSVYRRYFRLDSGPIFDALTERQSINNLATIEYKSILLDIGAKDSGYYVDKEGKLTSFAFDMDWHHVDKTIYKRVKDYGWYPKQTTKVGKSIHKRFAGVKLVSTEDIYKLIGLGRGQRPVVISGFTWYGNSITIIPSDPLVAIFAVPEYRDLTDADAEDIWTPPAEMVEIKEWEAQRELSEWNDSVRERNATKDQESA